MRFRTLATRRAMMGFRTRQKQEESQQGFIPVKSKSRVKVSGPKRYTEKQYMYEFHTRVCSKFMKGKCSMGPQNCFDCHCDFPMRRKVQQIQHEYNYSSSKCWSFNDSSSCSNRDSCHYAHTEEEVLYHPSTFRTAMCHLVNQECPRDGVHCPYAHKKEELRSPQTTPRTNPENKGVDDTGFHYHNPTNDPLIHMARYKTEKCSLKPCSRSCEKYHSLKERRRSPLEFDYSEQPCSAVKSNGKSWGDPVKCEDGDLCEYSHTLLEQMYHPKIYKTGMCNKYNSDNKTCAWGPLCTHAHGEADKKRQIEALSRFEYLIKHDLSLDALGNDPMSPSSDESRERREISMSPSQTSAQTGADLATLRSTSQPLLVGRKEETQPRKTQNSPIQRPDYGKSSSADDVLTPVASSLQNLVVNETSRGIWSPMAGFSPELSEWRTGAVVKENALDMAGKVERLESDLSRSRMELHELHAKNSCTHCGIGEMTTAMVPCGHCVCTKCASIASSTRQCPTCSLEMNMALQLQK